MRRCGTRRWAAYPLLPLLQSRLRPGLSFSSFPTLVPLSQDPRKQPIHHPLNSQWQHPCRWPPDRWSLELIRQQWLPLHAFPDRISLVLFGEEPIAVGRSPESPSHDTPWQLMETPKNTEPDLFEGSTLATPLEGGGSIGRVEKGSIINRCGRIPAAQYSDDSRLQDHCLAKIPPGCLDNVSTRCG